MEYLIVPDRDTTNTSVTNMKFYKFNTVTEDFDLDSEKVYTGYNSFDKYCFTQDMQFSGNIIDYFSVTVVTGIK